MFNRAVAPLIVPFTTIKQLELQTFELNNGVRVHYLNNPSIDLVRVEIRILAGSCFQQKDSVAKACLKLLQEGTLTLNAFEIAEQLDYAGAYIETITEREFVSLIVYFPKDSTDTVFNILLQMLSQANFEQEKIDIFKQKTKNNLCVSLEKTTYLGYCELIQNIFGKNHPYGHCANLDSIDQFDREDVINFYQHYYHAANMRVFLAGNINSNVLNLLNQTLGNLPAKQKAIIPKIAIEVGERRKYIERPTNTQSSVYIGKRLFTRTNKHWMPLQVVNTILGGYFGSRLMTNIRENKGLAYDIASRMIPLLQEGVFFINADVNKEQNKLVVKEIYKEIDRLQSNPVPEKELSLVKNYLFGSFLRNFDGVFAQIERMVECSDFELNKNYWQEQNEVIRSIDSQTIQSLATTYLNSNEMTEIIVG